MFPGVPRAAGVSLLALVSCASATILFPCRAGCEPRFGDSTWVAPSVEIQGTPSAAGPRVAQPDNEPGWETALRAPFRLAFLPLRLLARGIEATGPIVERFVPPGSFSREPSKKRALKFSPEWIGAKVTAQSFVGEGSKLSLKGTWSPSKQKLRLRGHVGEGVSPVGAGMEALYDSRPSRAFHGIGNFSDSRRTYFQRRVNNAHGYLFAGRDWMRRVRVTVGLSDMAVERGSGRNPRSADVFSEPDAPFLTSGSDLWWYGSSADFAALDDSLAPTLGLHFRPEVRRYRNSDDSNVRYDQWRFEARGYVPVFAKRRVLAGRVVYEGVDPRDGSAPLPFYRLPESSDDDRFAGYKTGRFRDRRLWIGRAEYRWEIMPPIWAVALGELGEVASTASRLTLRGAHPSIGGGLRAKISDSRLARLEIARGHEGMTVRLDVGADF
jgi:hypothetical protein